MKHRAIKNLGQLKDDDLYREISEGLGKIHENCIELDSSSKYLFEAKKYRASRIIEAVSKEEAAKYLILIDALRCPRKDKEQFARQLAKFNDHMAKGVYAELCGWRPASYKELRRYIEMELDEYYLDGPMGVDWIFRNALISNREEAFYVDYIERDDGNSWLTPKSHEDMFELAPFITTPPVIRMIDAIHKLGLSKYESIKLFAKHWREFNFSENSHYQEFREANIECLKIIDECNLLDEATDDMCALVMNELPFPLYKEDMRERKIPLEKLREIQRNWNPEY